MASLTPLIHEIGWKWDDDYNINNRYLGLRISHPTQKITADFNDGRVTSDSGALLLAAPEQLTTDPHNRFAKCRSAGI